MQAGIHPPYRPVVFRDTSVGACFLTRSTITSDQTIELDGEVYAVIDVDISSASHPFWTGKGRVVDTEGRIEKFNRRYGSKE